MASPISKQQGREPLVAEVDRQDLEQGEAERRTQHAQGGEQSGPVAVRQDPGDRARR